VGVWVVCRVSEVTSRENRIPESKACSLVGTAGPLLPAFDTAKPDADGHLVRAYVESALREVHRLLAVTACRERPRKRRLAYVAAIGVIALGALIAITVFVRHMDFQHGFG
jgi:hypothetical protein